MNKELGKITNVIFGHGGYQDAMLGMHFVFEGNFGGVTCTESTWDAEMIECTESSKWTEEERSGHYSDIMRKLSKLLSEAKVHSVDKLKGVPVELTFENRILKDWRILTEVI